MRCSLHLLRLSSELPLSSLDLSHSHAVGICLILIQNLQINQNQHYLFCRNNEGLLSADQVLRGLGLDPSPEDCVATQRVCQIVSTRAAHLCAATLAAVLRQIRDNKALEKLRTTIGVDGSVYKNHPQ